MLRSFFEGVVFLGVPMIFLAGPAFFSLLQTSLQKGTKAGMFFAFGVFLSDSTLVALSFLGAFQLLTNPTNQLIAGFIGSIILFGYGIYTFTRKVHYDEEGNIKDNSLTIKPLGPFTYLVKGYFLNIANPFLLIFWASMVGAFSSNYNFETDKIIGFFAGTLFTVFLTDTIKCFAAQKIKKKFFKDKTLNLINKIIGASLIIFGVVLIFRVLYIFF